MLPLLLSLLLQVIPGAALVEVKAPSDAYVETLYVQVGDPVVQGDRLIQLMDPTSALKVLELQHQISLLQEELNNFRCSIESEECLFVDAILQRMRALVQKRQLNADDLQALEDDQKRKVGLLKEGLVNQASLQAADEAVSEKKLQLDQIDAQIEEVETQLVQGHKYEAVQKIVVQIQQDEIELKHIQEKLDGLLLRAPGSGVVKETFHLAGDKVTSQEVLLTISPSAK